jgi:hypothetical protein
MNRNVLLLLESLIGGSMLSGLRLDGNLNKTVR